MSSIEFEIAIQRKFDESWPVVVRVKQPDGLTTHTEGTLKLSENDLIQLKQEQENYREYGTRLGKALFQENVREIFIRTLGKSSQDDIVRVLLSNEADKQDKIKTLHWERLCAPIDAGGEWSLLARDQRVPFSQYIPTIIDRRFPPIGRRDLRALVIVASPSNLGNYNLAEFDVENTVNGVRSALGDIPCDVLANMDSAIGEPTLEQLSAQLTNANQPYTLLHFVCHGMLSNDGETALFLATKDNQVQLVTGTQLIKELKFIGSKQGLPHLTFLCTCESADPRGERALGGLGQRLVRRLGMPAVVAMTRKVTIETALNLGQKFYQRLKESGEVDLALDEATAGLGHRHDITVPALFSRLGGRPLFSDRLEGRELTDAEIEFGIEELRKLLLKRAPNAGFLKQSFDNEVQILKNTQGSELPAARQQRRQAIDKLNILCSQVLEISFDALAALDKKPPEYNAECPFPGLSSFRESQYHKFFFGREELVAQLQQAFSKDNFLAVLGPSGCGKSSVVLAGLIPQLQEQQPSLQMAYLTPSSEPVAGLQVSLSNVAKQPVVLVVDQFEELFTLCSDEDKRLEFIQRLLQFAEIQKVVITMRADFLGECTFYKQLSQRIDKNLKSIGPMDAAELGKAMKMQADKAYLEFEEGLNNAILAEVEKEPGAMPLLQYALRSLWNRRWGRWLCYEEYEAIGGVQKAISQTADAVYDSLSNVEQEQLKNIFIRLTRLDEQTIGGEQRRDTRRRVRLEELVPSDGDSTLTKKLVEGLAGEEARLVVTSRNEVTEKEEVEVAHEALIRHWQKLQNWLEENRSNLQLRETIRQAAMEWEEHEKDENYLVHRGGRLEDAKVLLKQPRFLNQMEADYVNACVQLREDLRKQEEERRQRELEQERKARKTAQRTTVGALIAGVIMAGLGFFAGIKWREAKINEIKAWRESAEELLSSGQDLDALIGILQTHKKLNNLIFVPDSALRNEIEVTLHKVVSGVREINRLEGHTLDKKGARGVNSVAFSGDGKLASGGVDGTVILWDSSAKQWKKFEEHTDWIRSISFSGDGKMLASAGDDHTVNLWDLETKTLKKSFKANQGWLYSISFGPDDKQIATGGEDGTVRLWDLSGNQIKEFKVKCEVKKEEPKKEEPKKEEPKKEEPKKEEPKKEEPKKEEPKKEEPKNKFCKNGISSSPIKSISFSPNRKMLASAGNDGTVNLWDLEKQELNSFNANQGWVHSISFSPDSQQIATGGGNGTIRLWDLSDKALKKQLLGGGKQLLGGHIEQVNSVSFNSDPDSKQLATGGKDGTVRLWDIKTRRELAKFTAHRDWIRSVTFSPNDRKLLASASKDGTVRLWNLKFQKPFFETDNKDYKSLWSVSVNQDNSLLAIAGNDEKVRLWDLDNPSEPHQTQEPFFPKLGGLFSISFSPTDRNLLAIAGYGGICLWKVTENDNKEVSCEQENKIAVKSVSFSPDGKLLATTGEDETANEEDKPANEEDKTAKLWKLDGNQLKLKASLEQTYYGLAVSFSPDGKQLATAGYDKTVKLWDLDLSKNDQPKNLEGHDGWVNSIDFSPNANGKYLATASNDGTVILWDLNGNQLAKWQAHTSGVRNLRFDLDGKLLATTGNDRMVRLWDLQVALKHFKPKPSKSLNKTPEDGPLWREFSGHTNNIVGVTFINKNNKKLLVTTARDGTARLWEVESTDELIVKGCDWVRDYLNNPTAKLSDQQREVCDDEVRSNK